MYLVTCYAVAYQVGRSYVMWPVNVTIPSVSSVGNEDLMHRTSSMFASSVSIA